MAPFTRLLPLLFLRRGVKEDGKQAKFPSHEVSGSVFIEIEQDLKLLKPDTSLSAIVGHHTRSTNSELRPKNRSKQSEKLALKSGRHFLEETADEEV